MRPTFSLKVLSGTLDFKGTVSEVSANAEVKGHLAVATGALTDFIGAVVRATGQVPPNFDASVVGNFTFDGGIEYTPTRLAVTDFKMSMGGETATGTLALEEGNAPSLTGHVALAKIDAEKWLALLAVPGAFQPSAPRASTSPPAPATPAAKPAPAAGRPPIPPPQRRKPAPRRRPPTRSAAQAPMLLLRRRPPMPPPRRRPQSPPPRRRPPNLLPRRRPPPSPHRPSPPRSRRFPCRWTSPSRSPSRRSSTARARSATSW